jgi:hypothetical protein
MKKIYITHCSAKKDGSFKNSDKLVYAYELYISPRIKAFFKKCKIERVDWAIFSDLYGLWFPDQKNKWYEKSPYDINEEEFKILRKKFDENLKEFDEIYFYVNPKRFHSLYKKLINLSVLNKKIKIIKSVKEISLLNNEKISENLF